MDVTSFLTLAAGELKSENWDSEKSIHEISCPIKIKETDSWMASGGSAQGRAIQYRLLCGSLRIGSRIRNIHMSRVPTQFSI